ncbi:MAG: hypothetical protein ACREX3_19430, partial [Gammaproteobacteria bacterium]
GRGHGMPSENQHLIQARHNEDFVQYLINAIRFNDWVATGIFYAAVHYVEAAFDARLNGFHTFSHSVREYNLIRVLPDPRSRLQYRRLKSASMLARYLAGTAHFGAPYAVSSFFYPARLQQLRESLNAVKQTFGYP